MLQRIVFQIKNSNFTKNDFSEKDLSCFNKYYAAKLGVDKISTVKVLAKMLNKLVCNINFEQQVLPLLTRLSLRTKRLIKNKKEGQTINLNKSLLFDVFNQKYYKFRWIAVLLLITIILQVVIRFIPFVNNGDLDQFRYSQAQLFNLGYNFYTEQPGFANPYTKLTYVMIRPFFMLMDNLGILTPLKNITFNLFLEL